MRVAEADDDVMSRDRLAGKANDKGCTIHKRLNNVTGAAELCGVIIPQVHPARLRQEGIL
jgi:hypothetical protein